MSSIFRDMGVLTGFSIKLQIIINKKGYNYAYTKIK